VFSPVRVVQDVVQACRLGCAPRLQASGAGIELQTGLDAVDEAIPSLVEGDRNRIAQVLQNLVTNACKFGRSDPVSVRACMRRAEDWQPNQLVLTVADTGRGMSAQEAAGCFNSGQAAAISAGGGTGLGLYSALAAALRMHAVLCSCFCAFLFSQSAPPLRGSWAVR